MKDKFKEMLSDWSDPYGAQTVEFATEVIDSMAREIDRLNVDIAGKEAVISALHEDLQYYRKDQKDQMIQDQGLDS